ncbi:hypothetical protein ACN47E_000195 [Coniothyrium glycines]
MQASTFHTFDIRHRKDVVAAVSEKHCRHQNRRLTYVQVLRTDDGTSIELGIGHGSRQSCHWWNPYSLPTIRVRDMRAFRSILGQADSPTR